MSNSVADLHSGFWTNWEQGPIFGRTITLEASYASFLSNFLAIFITWAGTHLWTIICYVVMQSRSSKVPRDGLHHQTQVLLRNSPSVGGTIWGFMKQAQAWRRSEHHAVRRTMPLVLLALVYTGGFTAAGILSSKVSQPGSEVLLEPGKCGFPSYTGDAVEESLLRDNSFAREGAIYARNCFQDIGRDGQEDRRCNQFSAPRIGGDPVVDSDASCPFPDKSACKVPAMSITTNIPSDDLGINVPRSERMWFKKITTWSPLDMSNYVGDGWVTTPAIGDQLGFLKNETRQYYYVGDTYINSTFTYDWVFYARSQYMTDIVDHYKVWTATAYANIAQNFTPVAGLTAPNADITFLGVQSVVTYLAQVSDPLYRASTYDEDPVRGNGYYPDEKLSILGLTEQYQLCTEDKRCGNITGVLDEGIWDGLGLTDNQYAIAHRMRKAAMDGSATWIISALGSDALLASDYRASDTSFYTVGLPDEQWKTDVHYMHNVSLATMQRSAVEWASHPHREVTPGSNIFSDSHIDDPTKTTELPYDNKALARLCSRQKIRSYRYSSFSVFGVSMILGIGSFIILLNCTLSEIIHSCRKHRRSPRAQQKRQEWIETEVLQLHRMALDARGIGPWRSQEKAVPMPLDPNLMWGPDGRATIVRRNSDATLTPSVNSRWSQNTAGYQRVEKADVYQSGGWVQPSPPAPVDTMYQPYDSGYRPYHG
ncbi:hypothetical protein EJ05DRAFT_488432 [Pseudovirgaria hyperparasitica]|uniref:Uncharacterized protein n=1 Tax=Pseudovirgaria hyperparasitica TaxID=470096 RepID=A0A6A6VYH7_9PEZI|nr:uncharacterized protein EJ05DRAFT_488432 [Pseudovirgaria hyperparasitica]KAF2755708.1 hypothetical protein EJ05DRAFT_488432 [Pseudovirgaria hyperparasitica]